MWCEHRKISKVCLAIFQYYEWKGWIDYKYHSKLTLREKCPNTKFFLVRIQENTDQKKSSTWTLFKQCACKNQRKSFLNWMQTEYGNIRAGEKYDIKTSVFETLFHILNLFKILLCFSIFKDIQKRDRIMMLLLISLKQSFPQTHHLQKFYSFEE